MRSAANELRRTDPSCPALDDSGPFDELSDWSIDRRAGQWRASAFFQPGLADCQYANEIQSPLPISVTGSDVLALPWARITAAVPQATDAFSSPAGDMVIIVVPGELQFFDLHQRALGRKLLSVPAERVVMIQWALGRHVARWTNTLSQFANKPLREPEIRPSGK